MIWPQPLQQSSLRADLLLIVGSTFLSGGLVFKYGIMTLTVELQHVENLDRNKSEDFQTRSSVMWELERTVGVSLPIPLRHRGTAAGGLGTCPTSQSCLMSVLGWEPRLACGLGLSPLTFIVLYSCFCSCGMELGSNEASRKSSSSSRGH